MLINLDNYDSYLIAAAQEVADAKGIRVVVFYDRFSEHAQDSYGYMPEAAMVHFIHHRVVRVVVPAPLDEV